MAIIHKATLLPGKLDLLREYLSGHDALSSSVGEGLTQLGAFRFDDPAGNVGIETHLLTSNSGAILQIPVVYRNDPMEGAEVSCLGTMEHSVLGTRWVYDACIDPVYASELLRTILTGGTEVDEIVQTADGPVPRAPTAQVRGSGSAQQSPRVVSVAVERAGTATHISTGDHVVVVEHVLSEGQAPARPHLTGTWASSSGPIVLAHVT